MTQAITEPGALKNRLRATWMSGDFDKIAQTIQADGAEFIERLQIARGARALNVDCGTGNLIFQKVAKQL